MTKTDTTNDTLILSMYPNKRTFWKIMWGRYILVLLGLSPLFIFSFTIGEEIFPIMVLGMVLGVLFFLIIIADQKLKSAVLRFEKTEGGIRLNGNSMLDCNDGDFSRGIVYSSNRKVISFFHKGVKVSSQFGTIYDEDVLDTVTQWYGETAVVQEPESLVEQASQPESVSLNEGIKMQWMILWSNGSQLVDANAKISETTRMQVVVLTKLYSFLFLTFTALIPALISFAAPMFLFGKALQNNPLLILIVVVAVPILFKILQPICSLMGFPILKLYEPLLHRVIEKANRAIQ